MDTLEGLGYAEYVLEKWLLRVKSLE